MGRQVNFFLLPEDLRLLQEHVRSLPGTIMIPLQHSTDSLETLETLDIAEMDRTPLGVYLARFVDAALIKRSYVDTLGCWQIDSLRSPVLELDRCYFDGSVLRRGRLYFQTSEWNRDGSLAPWPADFIRWGDGLLRWVRKHYRKLPGVAVPVYLGNAATEWISASGARLDPGALAFRVPQPVAKSE